MNDVSFESRFDAALLRWAEPTQFFATGRGRDGQCRASEALAGPGGECCGSRHAAADFRHPDLARWRTKPPGSLRHEARGPGGVPRHLEADSNARPRIRDFRAIPQASPSDG